MTSFVYTYRFWWRERKRVKCIDCPVHWSVWGAVSQGKTEGLFLFKWWRMLQWERGYWWFCKRTSRENWSQCGHCTTTLSYGQHHPLHWRSFRGWSLRRKSGKQHQRFMPSLMAHFMCISLPVHREGEHVARLGGSTSQLCLVSVLQFSADTEISPWI